MDDLVPIDDYLVTVGRALAVGWLDPGWRPAEGSPVVDEVAFGKLCQLAADPWHPAGVKPGRRTCRFCRFTGGPGSLQFRDLAVQLGVRELFVPAGDTIYVAPTLIVHYIDAHAYSPPEVFISAVQNCPAMRSMAYLKAISRFGVRFRATGPRR